MADATGIADEFTRLAVLEGAKEAVDYLRVQQATDGHLAVAIVLARLAAKLSVEVV